MAVTLYAFLEAMLLLVNAVAILNEERFLSKVIGWARDQINQSQGFGHEEKGIKQQIANLVHAVRTVMRVPLIFLNGLAIVLELLLG
ncbi:immediate early response 3-interacting protein 1-like [Xenia sp. Carnegie-2017]|uniref:immediate early response 3-interacting protein 1-like n=1 Tax=Xenia sp. Carnegie-2017 TaxID=2897299 RepID=UPI001F0473EB|nr:immediate early response 3-interacting protein 1-like [Xenia sp. Carnegie-2017]